MTWGLVISMLLSGVIIWFQMEGLRSYYELPYLRHFISTEMVQFKFPHVDIRVSGRVETWYLLECLTTSTFKFSWNFNSKLGQNFSIILLSARKFLFLSYGSNAFLFSSIVKEYRNESRPSSSQWPDKLHVGVYWLLKELAGCLPLLRPLLLFIASLLYIWYSCNTNTTTHS